MSDQQITCPNCKTTFPLSSTLSAQIKDHLKAEFDRDFEAEKKKIWVIAQAKANEKIDQEQKLKLKDLETQNKVNQEKILESEKKELEFLKQKRELEERQKNVELELERKLSIESQKISEKAKKEAEELGRMKILEYRKQNDMMQKQIEELKRKAEQGSMQIQGEVQENDLKELLLQNFPIDLVEDVPTGIRGADLIQTVRSQFAQKQGIILWESKNTKTWTEDWIKKLKDDQVATKSDIAILVSKTLPEDIKLFGNRNGVWVCSYESVLPLISTLRIHLLEMGKIKTSLVGRDEKMEQLYNYLMGNEFRNKIENIVSAFTGMKQDLESEKRAMGRIWSKREKELERVVTSTSGLYGDLQGIAGNALPQVESLELGGGIEEEENLSLL